MNQQLLCSLMIEEKQHESLLIICLFELKCVILQQYRFVDLNLSDNAATGVRLWISVPETFWIHITFCVFTRLTSCCFQIVVKPLSLLPYLLWWQRIQQCLVAVMCANWWRLAKGPNDPRLLILIPTIRQYAVKLFTSGRLLIPILWFHFSLVLSFPPCNFSSCTLKHWIVVTELVSIFKCLFEVGSIPQGNFWISILKGSQLFCFCMSSKSLSLLQRHLFAYFWYCSVNDH